MENTIIIILNRFLIRTKKIYQLDDLIPATMEFSAHLYPLS